MKKWLLLIPMLLVFLSGCFNKDNVTGNSSQTGNSDIELTGRVLDKNGNPIDGVVAHLARTGLTDTTDNQGRYLIMGDISESSKKLSAEEVLDTLVFVQDGQYVAYLDVEKWVDTLPDVRLVQRNFSGSLSGPTQDVYKVEAILNGNGILVDNPVVAELFYNKPSNEFSGFIYFPNGKNTMYYEIYVNVYNEDGQLMSKSDVLFFNSKAGDITLPSFHAKTLLPIAMAGNDITASIKDTLTLNGMVDDNFLGTVTQWEWNIGGKGFEETTSGEVTIGLPDVATPEYSSVLRVTDDNGNTSEDTVLIQVLQDAPNVIITGDSAGVVNDTLYFNADATDVYGKILKYRWSDGIGSGVDDSTGSEFMVHFSEENVYTIIVEVEDDDGNIAQDSVKIEVVAK